MKTLFMISLLIGQWAYAETTTTQDVICTGTTESGWTVRAMFWVDTVTKDDGTVLKFFGTGGSIGSPDIMITAENNKDNDEYKFDFDYLIVVNSALSLPEVASGNTYRAWNDNENDPQGIPVYNVVVTTNAGADNDYLKIESKGDSASWDFTFERANCDFTDIVPLSAE